MALAGSLGTSPVVCTNRTNYHKYREKGLGFFFVLERSVQFFVCEYGGVHLWEIMSSYGPISIGKLSHFP